jgi:hypothetical protein
MKKSGERFYVFMSQIARVFEPGGYRVGLILRWNGECSRKETGFNSSRYQYGKDVIGWSGRESLKVFQALSEIKSPL